MRDGKPPNPGMRCCRLESSNRLVRTSTVLACLRAVGAAGGYAVYSGIPILAHGVAHVLLAAIVRLLHHQPSFAVLDEATSGLAPDIVSTVYATFEEREIRAITITQALVEPALQYHPRALYLGECCSSGWRVQELGRRETPSSVVPNDACAHLEHDGWVSDGWESGEEPEGDTPLVAG